MSRLHVLLRAFLKLVKAEEAGIAMFATEGIQEDKSKQRFPRNPVGTPDGIVASTLWAIWHHGSSVPRAAPLRENALYG